MTPPAGKPSLDSPALLSQRRGRGAPALRTCVAFMDDNGWSIYGAERSQPVAISRKWEGAENASIGRKPLPWVATGCRDPKMVSVHPFTKGRGSPLWLRKKCQVLRTRGPTGLDRATLTPSARAVARARRAPVQTPAASTIASRFPERARRAHPPSPVLADRPGCQAGPLRAVTPRLATRCRTTGCAGALSRRA